MFSVTTSPVFKKSPFFLLLRVTVTDFQSIFFHNLQLAFLLPSRSHSPSSFSLTFTLPKASRSNLPLAWFSCMQVCLFLLPLRNIALCTQRLVRRCTIALQSQNACLMAGSEFPLSLISICLHLLGSPKRTSLNNIKCLLLKHVLGHLSTLHREGRRNFPWFLRHPFIFLS